MKTLHIYKEDQVEEWVYTLEFEGNIEVHCELDRPGLDI
jgi:hypothetical protein